VKPESIDKNMLLLGSVNLSIKEDSGQKRDMSTEENSNTVRDNLPILLYSVLPLVSSYKELVMHLDHSVHVLIRPVARV
jgi:hypothetical protein